VAENQQNSQDLQPNSFKAFMNPVVVLAGIIVLSVLFLILCAIFGWDKGELQNMSRTDYARGLITYLFAVVTIGTAVVLVVSALTTSADDRHEKQFQRGKEILSLLLGVFGTIVGFCFGAEVSGSSGTSGFRRQWPYGEAVHEGHGQTFTVINRSRPEMPRPPD